ncbi:DUF3108 domain-containing protein [Thiobacter aerophilum]|uniref:DUF3108 domain-containing protein n=1 Tax=Thiobacter aerophilum TaxID=3121275 RepID=A0ABV0EEQ8_9BURK
MVRWLGALLFLCAVAHAAPARLTLHYSLSRNGQEVAEVVETFSQAKGRYSIESVTRAVGVFRLLSQDSIRFLSTGQVTSMGLKPLHFEHHRGSREARRIIADFDWKTRTARFQHDGEIHSLPIPAGLQDRLSLMYQFMYLKLDASELLFQMSNGRSISRYQYRRVGEETLSTPAGTFRTVRFSRVGTADEDGTDVWLALDGLQLPVKVVFEEAHGARVTQILTSLTSE